MDFAFGVDISLLKHIEERGIRLRDGGLEKDPLTIFLDHGVNYARLRLFVDPDGTLGQVNDLTYTLSLARRIVDAGLHLLLDLHYSDGWADPGQQALPKAWAGKTRDQLAATVYTYTADVMEAFLASGCLPHLVQIGNEITNGMMWPAGQLTGDDGWQNFALLLLSAISGARNGGYGGDIMIHVDQGGQKDVCAHFFDSLIAHSVPIDIIGLSYYPFWHGNIDDLKENLEFLAHRYDKKIIIIETGHDWRGEAEEGAHFPATPQGQHDFFLSVFEATLATPNSLGVGVFYWAPEWINGSAWSGPDWSQVWESRALFDNDGNALPAITVFDSIKQKFAINAATS